MTPRMKDMLDRYGECVMKKDAAKILNVHPNTIAAMCKDGRLRAVPNGRVDVRSICHYLEGDWNDTAL